MPSSKQLNGDCSISPRFHFRCRARPRLQIVPNGLRLNASDTEWSHGSGPEVSGPMLSLLMAMTGRKPVLQDLAGDGVATLRERP